MTAGSYEAVRNPQSDQSELPAVSSIDDARFWIGVMHRRTCRDADRLWDLSERIRRLERPWWKRWSR